MAIIGPSDLPAVLRVDSNPLKLRTMQHLGYPNVMIELDESQYETALRFVGDFIATYFPKEERYAYWYTKPLQAEYDLPADAYWIREVAWDPVITRINDVFSAEMFLFCAHNIYFHILCQDIEGNITLQFWKDINLEKHKLVTPYGPESFEVQEHDIEQSIVEVIYEDGTFHCTPNQPIKIDGFDNNNSLDGWICASSLKLGDVLVLRDGNSKVLSVSQSESHGTVTFNTPSGCFYGCSEGEPILIH